MGLWGGQCLLPTDLHPSTCLPRLETLSMRLTALLVRALVHLGLMPQTEGLNEYLET